MGLVLAEGSVPVNRRKFLRIAGSAGVIFAATGAGIGAFVTTRNPKAAQLP